MLGVTDEASILRTKRATTKAAHKILHCPPWRPAPDTHLLRAPTLILLTFRACNGDGQQLPRSDRLDRPRRHLPPDRGNMCSHRHNRHCLAPGVEVDDAHHDPRLDYQRDLHGSCHSVPVFQLRAGKRSEIEPADRP